jgi:uncharacterized protein (DUF4415 family)
MTASKRDMQNDSEIFEPDPNDDVGELSAEWFQQADVHINGKLVSRGRPKSENPKEAISIRLSPDVLVAFREMGPGWQTRIDEVLRDWVAEYRKAS